MEVRGPLSFLSCAFKLLTFIQPFVSKNFFHVDVSSLLKYPELTGASTLPFPTWWERTFIVLEKAQVGSLLLSVHCCLPFLRGSRVGGDCLWLYKVTRSPAESRQSCEAETWTSGLWFGSGICWELALPCSGNLHRTILKRSGASLWCPWFCLLLEAH